MQQRIQARTMKAKWHGVVLTALVVVISGGAHPAAGKLPNLWERAYPDIFVQNSGKLTRFWSPEAIAVPEGHAFIAQLKELGFSFYTPVIGILDISFDPIRVLADTRISQKLRDNLSLSLNDAADMLRALTASAGITLAAEEMDQLVTYHLCLRPSKKEHGTAVARLLNGQPPVGISCRGETGYLFSFAGMSATEELIWQGIVAMNPQLDIVNVSAALSGISLNTNEVLAVESTVRYVRKISAKTIVVTSAGNNFPNPVEANKRRLAKEIITVGSTDPDGCVSTVSTAGDVVTVCAPSSKYLQTIDGQYFRVFGGTSGATPLVTGALADVFSILPSLRVNEAVWLLQETAIMSKNTFEARDMIRSLNYYKLLRVAHRLSRDWPMSREHIFNREYYDFADEATDLTTASVDLGSTAESFTKLRQAFFLDNENLTARELLADIYRRAGYEAQAQFYGGEYSPIDKHKSTLHRFLTALADADLERMAELLPTLNKELFRRSFFHAIIVHMPAEKRRGVLELLRANGIADITVSEQGGIIVK